MLSKSSISATQPAMRRPDHEKGGPRADKPRRGHSPSFWNFMKNPDGQKIKLSETIVGECACVEDRKSAEIWR